MNRTDPAAQILAKAAATKDAAQRINTSRTEKVTVNDLEVGDVITTLGKVTFPFPFTLDQVQKIGTFGTTLKAVHGWFTPGPVKGTETVTRVI